MKILSCYIFFPTFLLIGTTLVGTPANAQIVPDNTLPTNSLVPGSCSICVITGGTVSADSRALFHSFETFSVPTNGSASFQPASGLLGSLETIFARVTGNQVSTIDGLIEAPGTTADLFFLNPNGITFSPNARLDVGGSFITSTAESLVFDDGSLFSVKNPQAFSLLTVNVPIGLQFGQNPGNILIRGPGHSFNVPDITFSPLNRGTINGNLQVASGQTLAFLGGDVTLDGAILNAPEGRIEVGAIGTGQATLSAENGLWTANYDNISNFQDVHLVERAAIDASGFGSGTINVVGRQVALTDGSIILMQNFDTQLGGQIQIQASESLLVRGRNQIITQILSETLADGRGADIKISTQQVQLEDGGRIFSNSFSNATGGNITVRASESVDLFDFAPPSNVGSGILAFGFASGQSGQVAIFTKRLAATNGASVSSTTFGSGSGGQLLINANESIEAAGVSPGLLQASTLSSTAFGSGSGSSVTINTGRLVLQDGGRVGAATFNTGNAGEITINASESVTVKGTVSGSINPTQIVSSANILDPVLQAVLGLPESPSGNGGNVTISTPLLRVADGAEVSVRNVGTGDAGKLVVSAIAIQLDQGAQLTASTLSGEGGNINLQVQESLTLRQGSQISVEAGGTGNGGNIIIEAGSVVAVPSENSDIIANAFAGSGGNIQITTQGLFGLDFRQQLTPESDIVASSQFGIDGIVQINTPELDADQGLVELPSTPTDPSTQIATGCATAADNFFVITGRGNLPKSPNTLGGQAIWHDLRPLELDERSHASSHVALSERSDTIPEDDFTLPGVAPTLPIEATGFMIHDDGQVELIATNTTSTAGQNSLHTGLCGAK